MTKQEWEAKCLRCGKCCYRLTTHSDGTQERHLEQHCDYLDTATNLCTIYEDRFKINPHCRELFELMLPMCKNGFLPKDCGYLK